MNIKLIFKSLVIIAFLVLLVIMGLNNPETVKLSMPNILPPNKVQLPAALMYIAFFGAGFLVGAILMAGGKKSSSSGGGKSGGGK